jgi:hypothetical protein
LGPAAPSLVPGGSTEAENKSFALKFKSMKTISSSADEREYLDKFISSHISNSFLQ